MTNLYNELYAAVVPELTIKMPVVSDYTGQIIVHIKDGRLEAFYPRRPGEIMASLDSFIELLRRAGWIVKTPEEE
ncbi:hypothetical protein [Serratia liquefaciens]|uniref:hypothetical protein n=1 Tax=Serratia liquefaciens TaxID=614 RepID=UPI003906A7BF